MGARERMFGAMLVCLLAAAGVSCDDDGAATELQEVAFEDLTADPGAYADSAVRVTEGFWVSSFEQSVLTGALAESYPPQSVEPMVWVAAQAEGDCVITDEGVSWGQVVAEGTFRYDEGGGFGHLGVYTMELDDPTLGCP